MIRPLRADLTRGESALQPNKPDVRFSRASAISTAISDQSWLSNRKGDSMKIPFAAWAVMAGVVVGFAAPARMAGHEPKKNKEHHLYRLVDLGTLGGPDKQGQRRRWAFLPGEQHSEQRRKSRGGWGHDYS